MRLTAKFALSFIIIILLLSGVVYIGFENQRAELIDREQDRLDQRTTLVATELNNEIQMRVSLTQAAAGDPRIRGENVDNKRVVLDQLRREAGFEKIQLLDQDREIELQRGSLTSMLPDDIEAHTNVEHHFTPVERQVEISEPIELADGSHVLLITIPIYEDTSLEGFVRGVVSLDDGSELLAPLLDLQNGQEERTVTVTSRAGETVYQQPSQIDDPVVSTAHVLTTGWTVQFTRDRADIVAETRETALFQAGGVTIVVLTLVLFAVWIYRDNIRQIQRLETGFEAFTQGDYTYELTLDGGTEWRRISSSFNTLGETLTQRTKALEHERDTFSSLFTNIRDAAAEIQYDGETVEIVAVNDEFEKAFATAADAVRGKSLFSVIPGEPTAEERSLIKNAMAGRETDRIAVERETPLGNRTCFVHVVTVNPCEPTTEGVSTGYVFYADVTNRFEQQKQIQILNRVLRHDLRTGSNIIAGNADLLLERLQKRDAPANERAYVKTIKTRAAEIESLSERTQQLKSVLETDTLPGEPINVVPLLVTEAEKAESMNDSAKVVRELPEEAIVYGSSQLSVVFEHLIDDAVTHNDQEEPTVTIRTVEEVTGELSIEFVDNGPPIPETEKRLHVGDEDITQLTHSNGVGFWVVETILNRHRGALSFDTPDHRGNIVRITLNRGPGEPDRDATKERSQISTI